MKRKFLKLFIITIFTSFFAYANSEPKCVRGCLNMGFFAEFFWTLNHLEWCEATNQTPVVYWNEVFAYSSKDGYNDSQNCWEYYFEPVSDLTYDPATDHLHTQCIYHSNFTSVWWYVQYILNIPLLSDEEQKSIKRYHLPGAFTGDNTSYPVVDHLYSASFRHRVKQLIDKYIVLKPSIQKKIDEFYTTYMKNHRVIGVHLRGSFIGNEVGVVPIELILEEANKIADENTIFFVATDQKPLLEQAQAILKGKVIAYDCYRQDSTTSPYLPGQWPPKMGEDVLIETCLLAKCDYFIHTISNVSTAALYFNPDLPHLALYCDDIDIMYLKDYSKF